MITNMKIIEVFCLRNSKKFCLLTNNLTEFFARFQAYLADGSLKISDMAKDSSLFSSKTNSKIPPKPKIFKPWQKINVQFAKSQEQCWMEAASQFLKRETK